MIFSQSVHSILFFLIFVMSPFFAVGDYMERIGQNAKVNWSKGEVSATGIGIVKTSQWSTDQKIEAHRAATLDAMRQLVEAINNIHVDDKTKVGELSNGIVKKRISGMVKNFTECGLRFQKNGICEVDVSIPLNGDGSIADIILGDIQLPKATDFQSDPVSTASLKSNSVKMESETSSIPESQALQKSSITSTKPQALTEEKKVTDKILKVYQKKDPVLLVKNTIPPKTDIQSSGNISGLVVNVSGEPVCPALSPKIITENGTEMYGFNQADRDFRKINGLASYATNINDAKLDKRVTENPFVIDAVKTDPGSPCTIVIREEDADKFMQLEGSDRILKHCRVIIVSKEKQYA